MSLRRVSLAPNQEGTVGVRRREYLRLPKKCAADTDVTSKPGTDDERTPVDRRSAGNEQKSFPQRLLAYIDALCTAVMSVALVACCGITFASVLSRAITGSSLYWSDTACEIGLATLAFLGAVSGLIRSDHVGLKVVQNHLRGRTLSELGGVVGAMAILVAGILAYTGLKTIQQSDLGDFPATGWPTFVLYVPLAVGAALMAVAAIGMYKRPRLARLPVIGLVLSVVLVAVGWLFLGEVGNSLGALGAIVVTGIVILALIAIGTPIAVAILVGAIVGITMQGQPFTNVPLQMTDEVTSISLLALPLFILVGVLYGEVGFSAATSEVFRRVGRKFPASEGLAIVGTMFVFSGLSGSKLADVSAVAPAFVGGSHDAPVALESPRVTHSEADTREGAQADQNRQTGTEVLAETSGVISAAAVMGEVIAPSIAMLVLGSVTTISTGALFVAGLFPAVVVGFAIVAVAMLRSRRLRSDEEGPLASLRLLRLLLKGIPGLGGIIIIAASIIGGIATAGEASAVAAVYSLLLAVAYRVRLKVIVRAIVKAARLSGMLLFLIGAAGVLSWFLTTVGLSQYVADLANVLQGDQIVFMLVFVPILMLLGSAFEGLPAIILVGPMFVSQASNLGINPLHAGVVFLLAMGAGVFLPPLGSGFYTSCAACRVAPEKAIKTTCIYMLPVVVGMLIVAFIPAMSLWLPHVLGLLSK